MDSTAWSATFAGVSACASVITAIIAAWSLSGARKDSRDRTRPVVIARLRKGPSITHGVLYLSISNVGQSVARNVLVAFDPPLPENEFDAHDQPNVVGPIIMARYRAPLEILAPGEALSNIYFHAAWAKTGSSPLAPDNLDVTVRYQDDHGKRYEDIFPLNVKTHGLETQSNPSDSNSSDRRRDKALESISWELWNRGG